MADGSRNSTIRKLDFPESGERRPLIARIASPPASRQHSPHSGLEGRFFENVAEGIQARDRVALKREIVRYSSFLWALICCLSCGSITAFSLYAPLFQDRLRYTQAQVNTISIVAELALYLPVPAFGLVADRYGPGVLAFASSFFFGLGYFLAAFTYRSGPPPMTGGEGWPLWVMVLAFVGIGMGTSCMYLGAVTTCAKNFGRGKHKGFALAVPIACFGLSGMWQSQVGDNLLRERLPDGSLGNVDVFRYFLFLGGLLLGCGLIGSVLLRVVDEDEMIDDAVDELERSGLLQESDFFMPHAPDASYGTVDAAGERRASAVERARRDQDARKKTWLLNEETTRFLSDHTMWWLTAGFFLVTGPGEAFINNIGTIIGTLYPAPTSTTAFTVSTALQRTAPSTHVSIIAVASTVARILAGTLSDLFGPSTAKHAHRRGPNSLTSSLASLDPLAESSASHASRWHFTLPRPALLLASTLLLSVGQVLLASGAIQLHAHDRLWLVSTLVGTGYGATFSLVPIIISAVWGVENFGTNWGIVAVAPAPAAAVWGAVYASIYQGATAGDGADRCFGWACYGATFWGMAVSSWLACALWLWAWKGPGGWSRRGVAV